MSTKARAKTKTTKTATDLVSRIKVLLEKENASYEAAGIVRRFVITFPYRQKPPLLGRIAVKLLTFTGAQIQVEYNEIKK